jgi:hypothetical protein
MIQEEPRAISGFKLWLCVLLALAVGLAGLLGIIHCFDLGDTR